MNRFVAYDVTRLLVRYAVPSPNGIDRVDLAYARHFLARPPASSAGVYMHGLQRALLQPALLHRGTVAALLSEIEANWQAGAADTISGYQRVKDFLCGASSAVPGRTALPERSAPLSNRLVRLRLLRPSGLRRSLFDHIPIGAAFIHTTHYPHALFFRWLERRPDVKPVFFIHDLLPLQFPEYFARGHIAEHRRAMEIFARHASAVIVNTRVVEQQVKRFLTARGRGDIPVLVRPIPPDPIFAASRNIDPDLAGIPYFVVCGTIEPRKNHLLLLHVWRELSRQWGNRTPKLVVIGRRGWENENVVDLLDRSHELRRHVIEIGGMPTAGVARLMAGARALLMPSFAEGYGLPIVEASAAGAPVIAADVPVFREVAPEATFRPPLDGVGWLEAIKSHTDRPVTAWSTAKHGSLSDYFAEVEAFIQSL
jgi:glycosyltransferase involved in cell wall biosynthesis